MTIHLDDCGNEIRLGDVVRVTALNSDRGAILDMTQTDGTVVGFGRTRVRVEFRACRFGVDTVGAECMHIVRPVDGRSLRTWTDIWGAGHRLGA